MGDLVVVLEALSVHDDLQVLEAAAVVDGNEAEVLHVAAGANPTGHSDLCTAKLVHIDIESCDPRSLHKRPPRLGNIDVAL